MNLSLVLHRCQSRLYEAEANILDGPRTALFSDKRDLPFPFETGITVLVACLLTHNRFFRMTLEVSSLQFDLDVPMVEQIGLFTCQIVVNVFK